MRLPDGAEGALIAFDGSFFTIQSPTPFAPGTPLRIILALGVDTPVDAKIMESRRSEDGSFTVRLRPISLAKHTRRALMALVDGG